MHYQFKALKEIGGNILQIPIADQDKYHCVACDEDVPEDEYLHKKQCCFQCFWDSE